MSLAAPVTYQGAKHRYAKEIIDRIGPDFNEPFHDVCCGSGTVSIELVNRGFDPKQIHMVDSGPWGLVWRMIGDGSFDLDRFRELLNEIPDRNLIQAHAKHLSRQPASLDTVYVYLILQACAFGGKAIWIEKDRWKNTSFRSFWQPNGVARRKSTVNPMMPMPNTLLERTEALCKGMLGVHGYWQKAENYLPRGGTVYIDPPYENTTGYGGTLNTATYLNTISGVKCFVSEGRPFSFEAVQLADANSRARGGISGTRKKANAEWLSNIHLGL